jgi:hypothetical protein
VQYSKREAILFRGASLRNARQHPSRRTLRRDHFILTARSVTAMAELACVRGPDPPFGRIERRVTARHLSVMRARGVTARSTSRFFSRSSSGVADRCIPRGTLPHRSAVFRVPRILSDTRAARIRVRLTAAAAGCGSSTPWCSSAARPCSPFDDHDRSGSITLSVVEVAHGFSLLTFRCRESVLRALSLRRSSFELVLSHLAMIEPALADAHLSAFAPASPPFTLR